MKIIVYTKDHCPYCDAAKNLLRSLQYDYREVNVDHEEGGDERRQWLVQVTGQRTLPQIFIDEQSIGGFTELRALAVDGKLSPNHVDNNQET